MSYPFSTRQAVHIKVSLEPVYNALNSFSLLSATERVPGLNAWVARASATLTPERRHTNRLVFEGLRDALAPGQHVLDFPAYLKYLAGQDPYAVRDQVLERLRSRFSQRFPTEEAPAGPDAARLLSDVRAYLTCVEYVQIDTPFDPALQAAVHTLLNDAPAMHHLIISHLEELWNTTFAAEWRRVQSSLSWQVEMFTRGLDEEATIEDTFHTFTGRDLPADLRERFITIPEIILVPSWHMGRHVALWQSDVTARLFFSEPPNYDITLLRSAPVRHGELRARLDALADETRMRILELLVQQDELHAQDIIAALDLSQSSVSRHLKQLVSMGYLYERRGEGANKTYRLSSIYFERTARAIEQLVSAEDTQKRSMAEKHDETQPRALRRFLNGSGKLTMWPPAKQRDKLLILEYLASFFEQGHVYSEKEVNELLLLHSTIKDSAALRRALYEYRFMNRTRDGSRYWLTGSEFSEEEDRKETP